MKKILLTLFLSLLLGSPVYAGGSSLFVSGEQDEIELGSDSDIDNIPAGSITVWFKMDSLPGQEGIFGKDNAGGNPGDSSLLFDLIDSNDDVEWFFSDHVIEANDAQSDSAVSANTWHSLTVRWGSSNMVMNLDGSDQSDTGTNNDGLSNAAATLYVGGLRNNLFNFGGNIAYFYIYTQKMPNAETAYQTQLMPESYFYGRIRAYHFNESSLRDHMGNYDGNNQGSEISEDAPPVLSLWAGAV
jgi:hypothetical protein